MISCYCFDNDEVLWKAYDILKDTSLFELPHYLFTPFPHLPLPIFYNFLVMFFSITGTLNTVKVDAQLKWVWQIHTNW